MSASEDLFAKIKRINPKMGEAPQRPVAQAPHIARDVEKIQRELQRQLTQIDDELHGMDAALRVLDTRELSYRHAAREWVMRQILRLDPHLTLPASQASLHKQSAFLRWIGFSMAALLEMEKRDR